MTQEELNYIKDSFSQILDDIGGNPDWYDAAKAVASDLGTMEKQLEERVTKLPSNLDEAAEEYYDNMWDDLGGKAMVINYEHDIWYPSSVIETVFKAGAEWMAGQGYTKEGVARPDDCEIWINFTDTDIKDGDEVIVQIRKK